MSLAADLLDQAFHLAKLDAKRPRQASLRRAVSTAYYALFHLLVDAAVRQHAPNAQLQPYFARAFDHGDIKKVCGWFSGSTPGKGWTNLIADVPDKLRNVAVTFVDLQEARHTADYDLSERFHRSLVMEKLRAVEQAFEDWAAVEADDVSKVFLSAFLLVKHSR